MQPLATEFWRVQRRLIVFDMDPTLLSRIIPIRNGRNRPGLGCFPLNALAVGREHPFILSGVTVGCAMLGC